jgi:hypothetical protein
MRDLKLPHWTVDAGFAWPPHRPMLLAHLSEHDYNRFQQQQERIRQQARAMAAEAERRQVLTAVSGRELSGAARPSASPPITGPRSGPREEQENAALRARVGARGMARQPHPEPHPPCCASLTRSWSLGEANETALQSG